MRSPHTKENWMKDLRGTRGLPGLTVFAAAGGALAIGAFAIGAFAIGAFAIGAFAIGALAIRRLAIHSIRIDRAEIKSLEAVVTDALRLPENAVDQKAS
jgi:hypothetical protein